MAVSAKLTSDVSNAKSILRRVNGVLRNKNTEVEECIKLIKITPKQGVLTNVCLCDIQKAEIGLL